MATINALIDRLILSSGLPAADVRARARYLREAGLLPPSAKGPTPQTEAVHAEALLLASVASAAGDGNSGGSRIAAR